MNRGCIIRSSVSTLSESSSIPAPSSGRSSRTYRPYPPHFPPRGSCPLSNRSVHSTRTMPELTALAMAALSAAVSDLSSSSSRARHGKTGTVRISIAISAGRLMVGPFVGMERLFAFVVAREVQHDLAQQPAAQKHEQDPVPGPDAVDCGFVNLLHVFERGDFLAVDLQDNVLLPEPG